MVEISVIVTVYNGEKYLEKCLDSILSQTFKYLEVIVINDGSTDKTLSICEAYQQKDTRLRVYTVDNGGVSAARNTGLQKSVGKYIAFVDADDWLNPQMYEKMYANIKNSNASLVMCGFNKVTEANIETSVALINSSQLFNREDVKTNIISKMIGPKKFESNAETIMGSVWRLLIDRNIITDNNIKFKVGLAIMEDLLFCLEVLLKCDKVFLMEENLYYYRVNSGSATFKYRENFLEISLDVYNSLIQILEDNDINRDLYKANLSVRLCNIYVDGIFNVIKSKQRSFFDKMKEIRRLCNFIEVNNLLIDVSFRELNTNRKIYYFLVMKKQVILIYIYYKIIIKLLSLKR